MTAAFEHGVPKPDACMALRRPIARVMRRPLGIIRHGARRAAAILRAASACAAFLAPVLCAAQPGPDRRPSLAHREARAFDFEEIDTNPAPVPVYWVRAQDSPQAGRDRPGFPIWNAAELDDTAAHTGSGSVRLPTRGGSTSLLLERGVLPVFQRADYVVAGYVRTEGLVHARARIVARFLDSAGQVVKGSERPSDLVRSDSTWTQIRAEIPGDFDDASFLQIELQLLQPQQFVPRELGARQVFQEDFSGAAWFDDITVSQLPRIEISTPAPANIFVAPRAPDINYLVRDLTGEKLVAEVAVFDSQGTVVDRQSRPLTSGRTLASWRPKISALGWYRATLTVRADANVLARSYVDFLWRQNADPSVDPSIGRELAGTFTDWRRFELIATDPHDQLQSVLPDLVDRTGVGAVTVPVWEGLLQTPYSADPSTPPSLVTRLLDRGRQVTLSMPRVPRELAEAARVDPDDPWELARRGPELWSPYLDRYLDRFGQSIRRWEVGPPWDDRVFWDADRKRTLSSVVRVFERLVPGPILCVPWRTDLAISPAMLDQLPRDSSLRILLPRDMPATAISSVAAALGIGPEATTPPLKALSRLGDYAIVLDCRPDDRHSGRETAADAARRIVEFWRVFGHDPRASVAVLEPWEWTPEQRTKVCPGPQLGVLATLLPRLAGRRFVGELPAAPGQRALVFAPDGDLDSTDQGLVIAWNEKGDMSTNFRAYLGASDIKAFDIFSNPLDQSDSPGAALRITRLAPGRTPEVVMKLTDEPVIIEGVDPRLALFQASVRIDPPVIEASDGSHEHAVVLSNPWPVPIEVKVRVVKPGGVEEPDSRRDRSWRVSPRQARIIVDPGKNERIPIEFSFSPGEEAGIKEFVLDVDAASDQALGSLRIYRDVELGSSMLDVQLSAKVDRSQNVVVEAYVSNRGKQPLDLQLTAFAPTQARQRSVMTNLQPGAVAVRTFHYDRSVQLRGQRVYVTVEDVGGSTRLNKAIVIE